MSSSNKKYRPYFTLSELETLRDLVAASSNPSNQSLYKYLFQYCRDISEGLRVSAISIKPTILDSLELTDSPTTNKPSPEQSHNLFLAWQANATLTPREHEIVLAYRYNHGMLSPEEEKRYEISQGINF